MGDIKSQSFWIKLTKGTQDNISSLISKNNTINLYTQIQLKGSIIGILVFLIYFFVKNGNHGFDSLFNSFDFFLCVVGVGIYFALIEKMIELLKKDMGKITENVKTKMIIKICDCDGYCECKQDLNNYMKTEKGITII